MQSALKDLTSQSQTSKQMNERISQGFFGHIPGCWEFGVEFLGGLEVKPYYPSNFLTGLLASVSSF